MTEIYLFVSTFVVNLGYAVECRELRACDYGAPTIRKRLFVIARCDGLPIAWPKPTHGPGTSNPYRTAADCIDWSLRKTAQVRMCGNSVCPPIAAALVRTNMVAAAEAAA